MAERRNEGLEEKQFRMKLPSARSKKPPWEGASVFLCRTASQLNVVFTWPRGLKQRCFHFADTSLFRKKLLIMTHVCNFFLFLFLCFGEFFLHKHTTVHLQTICLKSTWIKLYCLTFISSSPSLKCWRSWTASLFRRMAHSFSRFFTASSRFLRKHRITVKG